MKVFANCNKKAVIYPFTVKEIAIAQAGVLKKLSQTDKNLPIW